MDYENYGYKGEELHDYMRFCEDLKRVLYRSHVCRILEEQVMDFQRLLCTREKFDKDPSATTRRYEKFTLDLEAIHQRRNSIRQDEERIYTYIAQKGYDELFISRVYEQAERYAHVDAREVYKGYPLSPSLGDDNKDVINSI